MFSKLANVVDCQLWQVSSVVKIGKSRQLPKLARFQLPNLAEFVDTKVSSLNIPGIYI